MNYNQKHTQALTRFRRGQKEESIRLFAEALVEKETAEGWNDWATAQLACGVIEEAETGYRRALELDAENGDAWVNLGVLAFVDNRFAEALSLLRRGLPHATSEAQEQIQQLIRRCLEHVRPEEQTPALESYLRGFAGNAEAGRQYFESHLRQYLAVMELLPRAVPGQRLLELGASYHHLSPALENVKNYELVCSSYWDGPSRVDRRVRNESLGEEFVIPVHNFDPESAPWPFADGSFDVVLARNVLEHLTRDPMLVLQEANRVLKQDGILLLTTPNLASARSIARAIHGDSPYSFGQYVIHGGGADRHNREYTAKEIERVLQLAGFGQLLLRTRTMNSGDTGAVLTYLLGLGVPVGRRGDEILALSRKQGAVQERFPAELYCEAVRPVSSTDGFEQPSRSQPGRRERLLIVHESLPQFDRRGPDMQLLQMLRILRESGHPITYVGRNALDRDRYEPLLREIGVEVYAGDADKLRAMGVDAPPSEWKFSSIIDQGQFDVAILVHGYWSGISVAEHYLNEIRAHSPHTKIVVLANVRHAVTESRMAKSTGLASDLVRAAGFERRELECYRLADLVLVDHEDDRASLLKLNSSLNIEILPIAASVPPSAPDREQRQDILFLADFEDRANTEALQWFRTEVWPKIHRALPMAKLHIAGNGCPAVTLASGEGIVCLGKVEELGETLSRYRVCVSPARLAAGIQSTAIAALAHAIPLVATTAVAAGAGLQDGVDALISDSAPQFAAAVTRAYNDAKLWRTLSENGKACIETNFAPARQRQQIEKILDTLRALPSARRTSAHRWSVRMVEELQPQILLDETLSASRSLDRRAVTYADYAECLLAKEHPAEACEQLQNVFAFFRSPLPRHPFFARVLVLLERCYQRLGDEERAEACGREALGFMPEFNLEPSPKATSQRGKIRLVKNKTAAAWAVQ